MFCFGACVDIDSAASNSTYWLPVWQRSERKTTTYLFVSVFEKDHLNSSKSRTDMINRFTHSAQNSCIFWNKLQEHFSTFSWILVLVIGSQVRFWFLCVCEGSIVNHCQSLDVMSLKESSLAGEIQKCFRWSSSRLCQNGGLTMKRRPGWWDAQQQMGSLNGVNLGAPRHACEWKCDFSFCLFHS